MIVLWWGDCVHLHDNQQHGRVPWCSGKGAVECDYQPAESDGAGDLKGGETLRERLVLGGGSCLIVLCGVVVIGEVKLVGDI